MLAWIIATNVADALVYFDILREVTASLISPYIDQCFSVILVPVYFLDMVTLFACFSVDCSSIRVGHG